MREVTLTQSDDPIQAFLEEAEVAERDRQQLLETVVRFEIYLAERGVDIEAVEAIMINTLAAFHSMGEVVGKPIRKEAEKLLWDAGLLQSPWSDLVADEFEGDGLSEAEMDEHVAAYVDRFVQNSELSEALFAQANIYRQFLVEHGLSLVLADEALVLVFAKMKLIRKLRPIMSQRSPHEEAIVLLLDSDRDCDAWRLLIDHEFLNWFDG